MGRTKTWIAAEVLSASDLNAEFNNILNNANSLISPITTSLDMNGNELILDADGDTTVTADSDDVIDWKIAGTDSIFFGHGTGNTAGFIHVDPLAHTVTASTDYGLIRVGNTNAVTVPAGTTAVAAGVYIEAPNLTATGTITNTASLYIVGAATEGGTDYALWVDDGDVQFDSTMTTTGAATFSSTVSVVGALDVTTASVIAAEADGADFIIEGGAATGMSILSTGTGNILFGDAADANIGQIIYDHSDNSLSFYTSTAIGMAISTAGQVTLPLQPAFLAHNSVDDVDATGDSTAVTVDFDTEIFDRGGNFASDTFTAPVTGLYQFSCTVLLEDVTTSHTRVSIDLVTSNRTYRLVDVHGDIVEASSGAEGISLGGSALADMDANDTAIIRVTVTGSTKIIDIGGSSSMVTYFSGFLAA